MTQYTCCFCNRTIEDDFLTSLLVSAPFDAPIDKQFDQQFFCHFTCLQKMMSPKIPFYLKDILEAEFKK